MPEKNYWGIETRLRQGEHDPAVDYAVVKQFRRLFGQLKMSHYEKAEFLPPLVHKIHSGEKELITHESREKFKKTVGKTLSEQLHQRAKNVVSYLLPHLYGLSNKKVVDFGSGDGDISVILNKASDLEISLLDAAEIPARKKLAGHLPFIYKPAGEEVQKIKDGYFGGAICLAALHHADDPLFELNVLRRIVKGKITIGETIAPISMEVSKWLISKYDYPKLDESVQQPIYAGMMDILINRLFLGDAVNCPLNMNSDYGWKKAFEKMRFELVSEEEIGIEHPVVGEYRKVYVLNSPGEALSQKEVKKIKRELKIVEPQSRIDFGAYAA